VDLLRNHGGVGASILEFGGANSCFIEQILDEIAPARYDIVDNNQLGLDLLKCRYPRDERVSVIRGDILSMPEPERLYDIVFSVGLIEHFDPGGTARAVAAHFRCLRPGGAAIITFPTPTWLYRAVRGIAEATNNWIFHDERPLRLAEFESAIANFGRVESARILWPLILTQYCVVVRKFP
jgi:SAM-dependent methyltransferase